MQFSELAKPPIGIVFDSDLGDGVDDVLALALIYALEAHSETRIVSTSTTKSTLRSAMFAEVLARFLMGPPPRGMAAVYQRPLPPVGMADDGRFSQDTAVLKAVLDKQNAEGGLVYPRTTAKLNDTADPPTLIRNALTAQHDENCLVVLAGPATNLARTLALPGVPDLIKAKVKCLLLAAPQEKLKADLVSARKLLAGWPSPVVVAGQMVSFPGDSMGKDFAWAATHPVVDAYLAYRTMPYDAPAPVLSAVLHALRPDSGFVESGDGLVSLLDDGRTQFAPRAGGRHRMLTVDPARQAEIVRTLVQVVSAEPLPRPSRRRTPKKEDPPAPSAPKPSGPPN